MLESTCAACHNLDRVNNKKGDKDAWTTTVTRMVGKGARLSDEDTPRLIDFLTRTRGQ
jgi:cytochrome c5